MLRRTFIKSVIGSTLILPLATPALAQGKGRIFAEELGLFPDEGTDQSAIFQSALQEAADRNAILRLAPGTYRISNIKLPSRVRMEGVRGASILKFSGGNTMIAGQDCELLDLRDITFDGAGRPMAEESSALLRLANCPSVHLNSCVMQSSSTSGLSLENCGGEISNCLIERASGWAALYSVDATGLRISGNTIRNCNNGGILVHRHDKGEDNTLIIDNRLEHIGAKLGGTGQWGNGINLHRSGGVIIRGNHISDCAFSAIRANSADNALISDNICLRSGETALYAEFSFSGSVISANLIDGGATGISIANFNEGGRLAVCNNNLVRNIHKQAPYEIDGLEFGVGIYAEADTSVIANVVENAPLIGIELGFGPFMRDVIASNNVIRETGIGVTASVTPGAGKAIISGNRIADWKDYAIAGTDHRKLLGGELAGGKNRYEHLSISNNLV